MTKREDFTLEEQERLQRDLAKQLGPEFLHHRAGPGGKFTYLEGQAAIQLANEHFGFNGWTSELRNFTVDFMDEQDGKVSVGVSAVIRVTLKDGTFHEDIGYGQMENSRSKAAAMEKAKKEAMTDALKRALRMFGNVMGNCIYDKTFTGHVQYMKPPSIPFDPKTLYRDKRYQPPQQTSSSSNTTPAPAKLGVPAAAPAKNTAPLKNNAPVSKPTRGESLTNTSPTTRSVASRQQQQQQQEPHKVGTSATKRTAPPRPEEEKDDGEDELVVSTEPPNQPPTPLRSSLSHEESFSMEGDDELFAAMLAADNDFDKPDLESQPLAQDQALNFSWSTSGDLKRASQSNKRKSIAESSPSSTRKKSPKNRR